MRLCIPIEYLFLGIKVVLILAEFVCKSGALNWAPTSIDEETLSQVDVEMATQQPSSEDQIEYHHNPMLSNENSEEAHRRYGA